MVLNTRRPGSAPTPSAPRASGPCYAPADRSPGRLKRKWAIRRSPDRSLLIAPRGPLSKSGNLGLVEFDGWTLAGFSGVFGCCAKRTSSCGAFGIVLPGRRERSTYECTPIASVTWEILQVAAGLIDVDRSDRENDPRAPIGRSGSTCVLRPGACWNSSTARQGCRSRSHHGAMPRPTDLWCSRVPREWSR